jgi:hypothetical protein
MLAQAAVLDPRRLAIVGLRLREIIDPDGADASEQRQRLLERQRPTPAGQVGSPHDPRTG